MTNQDSVHSSCISLRLDKGTLENIEDAQKGATLSAALGVRLADTLEVLAKNANKGECND